TATLLKPIAGRLSDRSARRKPLAVAGYALSNLSKPLFLFASWWPLVLALRFVDRIGKGIRTAPRDALLADSVEPERRGEAFGFPRAADNAGSLGGIGLTVAVLVSLQAGATRLAEPTYRTLVGLALVPAVLAVGAIWAFVREPDHAPAPGKAAERAPLPGALV